MHMYPCLMQDFSVPKHIYFNGLTWSLSCSNGEQNKSLPNMAVEKAMAPHSSTLTWKIPWIEEPGRLKSMGSLRVGHDWATSFSLFTFMHWRRKWQPLQCSFLENPRDGGVWRAVVFGVAQSRTWLKRLSSSSSSNMADGKIEAQKRQTSLPKVTGWVCDHNEAGTQVSWLATQYSYYSTWLLIKAGSRMFSVVSETQVL